MSEPFIGQIIQFAGNFAPRSWAFCNGQLMSIAQNTALFSILGTTYGGDGRTTFALPDLRGRVPVHPGTGPGLTTRKLGQRSGIEYSNLNILQMPAHNHLTTSSINTDLPVTTTATAVLYAEKGQAGSDSPEGNLMATTDNGTKVYKVPDSTKTNKIMSSESIEVTPTSVLPAASADYIASRVTTLPTGSNQPVYHMQPYLCVNFIIAMFGTFPSRS